MAPVKVLGSTILMTNRHSLDIAETRQESVRFWKDARTPAQGLSASESPASANSDRLTISDQARQTYNAGASQSPEGIVPSLDPEFFGLSPADRILILLLEKVLGIKIRLPDKLRPSKSHEPASSALQNAPPATPALSGPQRVGWGFSYDLRESYKESEAMSFTTKGIINTADGKQIAVEVQVNMSRQFAAERSVSLRAGDAAIVDPLVINYGGPAADITKTKFRFDIDLDGTGEEMPFVTPGSGFLVIDKNQDGVVNDGSEMFGPSTGNGFAELKQYDADKSGWLDAGDPIFERLRIWTKDDQGKDVLFALGQKGIGAIYLGNVTAAFSMKDEANRLQAQNTRMGIYLSESGQPGTVQQLDLAVAKE